MLHTDPILFLAQVATDQPYFAQLMEGSLGDGKLLNDIRRCSPKTCLIVCLLPQSMALGKLWMALGDLEFDILCTLPELAECLRTIKENRFYHSSLLATHPALTGAFPNWHELTHSERRVLKSTAEGQTGAQIAEGLHMSKKTVSNHKAKISQKLGVSGGPGSLTKFVLTNHKRILSLLE